MRIVATMIFGLLAVALGGCYKSNQADDYVRIAARYIDAGNYDAAIANCSKAIEIDPKNEVAYYTRGSAKCGKGDWSGGIADYSKAIDLNPSLTIAYYARGGMKTLEGDYDGAIADYDKLIDLLPTYAPAYSDRGAARSEEHT